LTVPDDDKAPFDEHTIVDAAELAEWLSLTAAEVRGLVADHALKPLADGRFALKASIQAATAHWERLIDGGRLN
jgi:hypothetical protein